MLTFAEFLTWLTALLGDDHDLVVALTAIGEDSEHADDAARYAAVTDEQLTELTGELRAAAQDENVSLDDLASIADNIDMLDGIAEQRETAAAEDAAAREALLNRIGGDGDGGDDGDGGGDGGDADASGDDTSTDADGAAADGADADAAEPVNASGGTSRPPRQPTPGRVNANARRPRGSQPSAVATLEPPQVRLNDNFGEFGRGAELSLDDFAEALLRATRDNRGSFKGAPQKLRVGTIRHEMPEARQLGPNTELNSARVAALQRDARLALANADDNAARVAAITQPLTAAGGGLCAPLTPYYPIQLLGDAVRMVQDFVMSMQADRGGITLVPPPSFVSGWGADLADGVSEWTVEDDAEADDPDVDGKPCAVLDCDDPITVVIEAVVKCLEVSNIRAMTYREQVEAALHYLSMHHARTAETALLVGTVGRPGIDRLVNETVTFDEPLGASREIPRAAGVAATALRDQHRMGLNETLDYLLPHWVPAAMALDVAAALTGTTTDEALAFSEQAVGRAFGRYNLRVGYFRDTQNFTSSGAFPSSVSGYMFPPGTFLGLNDPELDLGIVRDSVLNRRNRFRYFAETFEAIAKVGVVARKVTISDLCMNGAQAGTIDPADVDCLTVS